MAIPAAKIMPLPVGPAAAVNTHVCKGVRGPVYLQARSPASPEGMDFPHPMGGASQPNNEPAGICQDVYARRLWMDLTRRLARWPGVSGAEDAPEVRAARQESTRLGARDAA
jgi:hypothetical protein